MVSGYIEKIKYRNEENGYTVLCVSVDGEEEILVGTFSHIEEGSYISADVKERLHPVYGEQLFVESYELKRPDNEKAIEKYLASGAIKGIGPVLAARIVKKFAKDTLRIIEEEPERLEEVKGISENMARAVSVQVQEQKEQRAAFVYLQKYGISMKLANKIYKEYGERLYSVITENPYKLADDIQGVGFKLADEIAQKVGKPTNAQFRIKSGIVYILSRATLDGHVYLPMERLINIAAELLDIPRELIPIEVADMQIERRLSVRGIEGEDVVYLTSAYHTELSIARKLLELSVNSDSLRKDVEENLPRFESSSDIELDDLQRQAVIKSMSCGLIIITGGPGTGKTTTINMIIKYLLSKNMEVLLAAPTGRAAKRMEEATGYEAKTIHRLLEINAMPDGDDMESNIGLNFERNEDNPLEADAVIIDEMSMVDMYLMNSLLKAVTVGTRLILVGDTNQLSSVGPGNVLKDIIASGAVEVVKLERIYRQAGLSDIVINAHKMIEGEPIDLGKSSKDFVFIKRSGADNIISACITLLQSKLPKYVSADSYDIQIMSPMKKGMLGVERLNLILQNHLNPKQAKKPEKEFDGKIYRVGDKVMQTKNNYQIEWSVKNDIGIAMEKGQGVYNGDIGIIRYINDFEEFIRVEFDDRKIVDYPYTEISQLELAYAITIHKSQGSEYPAVIIPMYPGPKMLMNRNLIYTAVTRAKTCVALVGDPECFYEMTENTSQLKRYSSLDLQIKNLL